MQICELCHLEALIPIELDCHHIYCLLCLFYECSDDTKCKECQESQESQESKDLFDMNINQNFSNNIFYAWLYSSNYGNTWWLYKRDTCDNVEKIYYDYSLKKEIMNGSVDSNDNPINLVISKKTSQTSQTNLLSYNNDSFEEIDTSDDSVDFSDSDNTPTVVVIETQLSKLGFNKTDNDEVVIYYYYKSL